MVRFRLPKALVEALLETEPSEIVRLAPEEGKTSISDTILMHNQARDVRTSTSCRRHSSGRQHSEAQNALKRFQRSQLPAFSILVRSGDEPLLPTIYSRCPDSYTPPHFA